MKVCIESLPSGEYSVYQDDETQEQPGATQGMPEAQEMGESKPAQGQTAPDLQSALKIAIALFRNQEGGMPKSPFQKGFEQATQQPM